MQKKTFYKGFSSSTWLSPLQRFNISNIDVIKQDLYNHIFTVKGERIMMPDFGTRIPLMVFEPLDQQTLDIIKEDLLTVINYDPRVELLGIEVIALPDNSAIIGLVDVRYIEMDVKDTIRIEIPSQQ